MKKIILVIGLLILFISVLAYAGYNNYPPMPDKYLMPDGSIQTFSGVEVSPANISRANIYKQQQFQVAKWLLPDGSLVSALPFSGGISSYTDITKWFSSGSCIGFLKSDGTCNAFIGLTDASNVAITGGNVTGLTNLGAANLTVTSTVNATGATWTGLTVGSVTGAAATADLAEDLSTASHSIYKDSAGNIADIITAIDAHASNTTIALIPGICATIHNSAQGDLNAVSTLPALADGLCFTGLVVTTEDDKTFRLNAAAANTICLGATCGKDDIGFATGQNTKGGQFKCLGIGSDWFCHTITGTVDAGEL